MKKIILMLCLTLLLPSCMPISATPEALRNDAKSGGFLSDMRSVTVNVPLKKVVQRVSKKAETCMYYTYTSTGQGFWQRQYVPTITWHSKNSASLIIKLRFRQKSLLVETDDSGIAVVADMKRTSKNRTKITVYMDAALGMQDEFYDAIQSAAQGQKGTCPAEI